jgi:preprotein translocase subunit SecD
VSIGITADSSIIFFERIRDEVNLGKTVRTRSARRSTSAFRTNLAGNTVTLAAAVILYFLAVGRSAGSR